MARKPNHACSAAALAICALAWSAPSLADDGGGESRDCGPQTLKGSYVLAASGFAFTSPTTFLPKSLVEQIDFDGQLGGSSPAAAVSLGGTPDLHSNAGVGVAYEVVQGMRCVFKITFANGPAHWVFVTPDGEFGWTLQVNLNNSFQGTLTRVWPPRTRDDRR
jgi:hypothetical protein